MDEHRLWRYTTNKPPFHLTCIHSIYSPQSLLFIKATGLLLTAMSSPAPGTASARTRANPNIRSGNSLHINISDSRLWSINPPDEEQDNLSMLKEDAYLVISLSISRAQTRLTSPQTPAAEKVAAIGALDAVNMFDGATECDKSIQEEIKHAEKRWRDRNWISWRS